MLVINYPQDIQKPEFYVSAVDVKICVSRICPGIIEEKNQKYINLPVIKVEDLDEYKRLYTSTHETWVDLIVYKTLNDTIKIPTKILKNISPLTREKLYYPTNLTKWNTYLNDKELNRILTTQKDKDNTSFTIGAMELD